MRSQQEHKLAFYLYPTFWSPVDWSWIRLVQDQSFLHVKAAREYRNALLFGTL